MKLIESIQIRDGVIRRINYHNKRLNYARKALFCLLDDIYLEEYIQIPEAFLDGLVKCRVEYGEQIKKIEFEKYQVPIHNHFYLIDSTIEYPHKYIDRNAFRELKFSLPLSSEIIIVKDGFITDTSYSNLIFKDQNGEWVTPNTYLLKGTQREFLLDEGVIKETSISISELRNFTHFMMINAMLDFDETKKIPIDKIRNLNQ